MNKSVIRDLAKFAAGLVLGDFLVGVWFLSRGLIPFTFLGVTWTVQNTLLWLVFDAIIIGFLVTYGWHINTGKRTASERAFLDVAGFIFGIVALAHLSRLVFGWNLQIGSFVLPYWMNALGAVVALFLSYASFHLAHLEERR